MDDGVSFRYLALEGFPGERGSLEPDGDDGVSGVEEARRSPSAGVCEAVFAGGGPSRASSKVFLTPCQKLLVKTSFISFLAYPSWYLPRSCA